MPIGVKRQLAVIALQAEYQLKFKRYHIYLKSDPHCNLKLDCNPIADND
jgi:hypothetical protein